MKALIYGLILIGTLTAWADTDDAEVPDVDRETEATAAVPAIPNCPKCALAMSQKHPLTVNPEKEDARARSITEGLLNTKQAPPLQTPDAVQ